MGNPWATLKKILHPLENSKVLVVEPNDQERQRLLIQLSRLGAPVILAGSIVAAIPKLPEATVVVTTPAIAGELTCDLPVVLVTPNDRVGLRCLLAGKAKLYVLEGSDSRTLGRAITCAQVRESVSAHAHRLFSRAAALSL